MATFQAVNLVAMKASELAVATVAVSVGMMVSDSVVCWVGKMVVAKDLKVVAGLVD